MKLRKPLAILLTLALFLGLAPIAGADKAIGGQTTFQSTGTVTSDTVRASTEDRLDDVKVATIDVTITNIYTIQVNPYGMSINIPGTSDTSTETIVTSPMIIWNNTDAEMKVTATATAIPKGDVTLESEPPEVYVPDPFDDPNLIPNEERVYLYLQMTEKIASNGDPDWTGKKKQVITKEGGSDPLDLTMAAYSDAAIQIGGSTSLPTYYGSWHRGNGFDVVLVLSFTPMRSSGYTVSFDAKDTFWDEGDGLMFPIEFLIEGKTEPLLLEEGYVSSGTPRDGMSVDSTSSLTFTVKAADKPNGHCYMISDVILIRENDTASNPKRETLWHWDYTKDKRITSTHTINAANVYPKETIRIEVILTDVTF